MRTLFLGALTALVLMSGCTFLRQVYGIPDPNYGLVTPEEKAALIAASTRDSSVVFVADTLYYIGRPTFKVFGYLGSNRKRAEVTTLTGSQFVQLYLENSRTPGDYVIQFNSPTIHAGISGAAGPEDVVARMLKYRIIGPTIHEFDSVNLRRAVAAGAFRYRPDLDSAYEEMIRRAVAERRESAARRSTTGSSSSSSSSSSGSSSSSREETEAEKAQRRFFNSPSVRNTCSKTVRVFVGDKPPYSSGINMTVSGNSINASLTGLHSGVKFWIIDEHEQPITGITVGDETREIEIGSDGRTLRQK